MQVTIYSKPTCPQCDQTKALLKAHNIPFTELRVGENVTREEVLEAFPNARMMPIIVVDGQQLSAAQLRDRLALLEDNQPGQLLVG